MNIAYFGKMLAGLGLGFLIVGFVLWILGDKLSWFGHLPGDFRVERRGFGFYFPLASMLLASTAFSIILWVVKRLFK